MMPMSPDDYKALEQYVGPRDIDAVVSLLHFSTAVILHQEAYNVEFIQ